MSDAADLPALRQRRELMRRRLALIADGLQLTYDDGAPIDMASEAERLEAVVADLDRRIEALERGAGLPGLPH